MAIRGVILLIVRYVLPCKQLCEDVSMIQLRERPHLLAQLLVALERGPPFFEGGHFALVRAKRNQACFVHVADFVAVELGRYCVVALLHRLILQVIHLEEVERGLVAPIDEHSELEVVEVAAFDLFYEGHLHGVVVDVDASCTVLAKENSVVHAHVRRTRPPAVEAVRIVFFLQQLYKNFLLQAQSLFQQRRDLRWLD